MLKPLAAGPTSPISSPGEAAASFTLGKASVFGAVLGAVRKSIDGPTPQPGKTGVPAAVATQAMPVGGSPQKSPNVEDTLQMPQIGGGRRDPGSTVNRAKPGASPEAKPDSAGTPASSVVIVGTDLLTPPPLQIAPSDLASGPGPADQLAGRYQGETGDRAGLSIWTPVIGAAGPATGPGTRDPLDRPGLAQDSGGLNPVTPPPSQAGTPATSAGNAAVLGAAGPATGPTQHGLERPGLPQDRVALPPAAMPPSLSKTAPAGADNAVAGTSSPQPAVSQPASTPNMPLETTPVPVVKPATATGQPVAVAQQTVTPASLSERVQPLAGIALSGLTVAKGSGRAAPGLAATDPLAAGVQTDVAPDADSPDTPLSVQFIGLPNLASVPDLAGVAVTGAVAFIGESKPATISGPVEPAKGTPSANPQTSPILPADFQTAAASGTTALRSVSAEGAAGLPVAAQIAPAIIAMAQSQGTQGQGSSRLSISITPDQLGQVHITVERATDGTTSIHVAAEQLVTLDLLRQDQGSLNQALDQAGVGQQGHSLSFSWDNSGSAGGGMAGWGGPDDQASDGQPVNVANSYPEEAVSSLSVMAAAARGGIDMTA